MTYLYGGRVVNRFNAWNSVNCVVRRVELEQTIETRRRRYCIIER